MLSFFREVCPFSECPLNRRFHCNIGTSHYRELSNDYSGPGRVQEKCAWSLRKDNYCYVVVKPQLRTQSLRIDHDSLIKGQLRFP